MHNGPMDEARLRQLVDLFRSDWGLDVTVDPASEHVEVRMTGDQLLELLMKLEDAGMTPVPDAEA